VENLIVLYEDDDLVAVSKPFGLIVHRTRMSEDKVFLLQSLRDQLGYPLYTIHRLDRPTSGVVLFGKTPQAAAEISKLFREQKIKKYYLAVVRGWINDSGVIEYGLKDVETGKLQPQEAVTHYRPLGTSEIDHAIGLKYPTARFSLTLVEPLTGRRHQIRKHFSHLRHPIIGDKKHGDVKQNKYFRENFGLDRMFLHALQISFKHTFSSRQLCIYCPPDPYFLKGVEVTGLMGYFDNLDSPIEDME